MIGRIYRLFINNSMPTFDRDLKWLTVYTDSPLYKELSKMVDIGTPPKRGIYIRFKDRKTGRYHYDH